jgi:hypothetical protein
MRGFLQPSHRRTPNEGQTLFATFSRGRRTKLAKSAQTTLLKADQWARADLVSTDVADALDRAVKAHLAKKKK